MVKNMSKIVVLLLWALNFNLLFSEKLKFETLTNKKNTEAVEKYRADKERDEKLEFFFDAIRKHRNKFVTTHLATRENIQNREEWKNIQSNPGSLKVYGPVKEIAEMYLNENELVDVNAVDKYGYTPIIVAIESGNNEILRILLENGANMMEEHPVFGKLTLHTAAYYENREAVEMLLEKNPGLVNVKSGSDGWSALQDATLKSNIDIVELLLKYGADPKQKDSKGGTAVDMATEFGKGRIVKLLRDKIKENRKKN